MGNTNSAGIYLLKVNNRTRCEVCSKLTIKTPERRQWRRFDVFIVNFEHVSPFVLVFLLLILNMPAGKRSRWKRCLYYIMRTFGKNVWLDLVWNAWMLGLHYAWKMRFQTSYGRLEIKIFASCFVFWQSGHVVGPMINVEFLKSVFFLLFPLDDSRSWR